MEEPREDELISINVGGQLFDVKRSTLLMAPEESLLNAMFSGRWDKSLFRDGKGNVFLDMSPPVFAAILSNLRAMAVSDGPKRFKRIPIEKVYETELWSTCNYYGLFPNIKPKEFHLQVNAKDSSLRIVKEGNGIAIGPSMSGKCRDAVGVSKLENGAVWKVTVGTLKNWFSAGIIAKETPADFSSNDSTCFGWCSRLSGRDLCEEGDVLVFMLDFEGMALKMYHSRHKKIYCMPFKKIQPWRLYFNLHGVHDTVKLSNATLDDVLPLLGGE